MSINWQFYVTRWSPSTRLTGDGVNRGFVHLASWSAPISRCFVRLDLNQGKADMIGMYCMAEDNPATVMRHSDCVESNELTEANGSLVLRSPNIPRIA